MSTYFSLDLAMLLASCALNIPLRLFSSVGWVDQHGNFSHCFGSNQRQHEYEDYIDDVSSIELGARREKLSFEDKRA